MEAPEMLTELHVKNLALIDEADVSFGRGLNILTGETGAGKSILLGAVNLALGQKFSKDMLRTGCDSALVELVFIVEHESLMQKLRDAGIEPEDGQVIITRRIRDGRSVNRINGETCTASTLKKAASLLIDIHGQHENQTLLDADGQLRLLDMYGEEQIGPLLDAMRSAYHSYREITRELSEYQIDDRKRDREIDLLSYEINEIREANLRDGEEEELDREYRRMANSRRIAGTLGEVCQMTGGEGAGDLVSRALRELSEITEYDDRLSDLEATLADAEGLLTDFSRSASDYLDAQSFSEEEFRETEERLDLIRHLESKYGRNIDEIRDYLAKQEEHLDALRHFGERKEALQKEAEAAEQKMKEAAAALTQCRKRCAEQFAEQIRTSLLDLNFLSAGFEVAFDPLPHCTERGADAVTFMLSTNPGEAMRPLSKIASGGELSRIMLAIRTIMADRDDTETLIFDEIDAGISGRTAQKVSEKMARVAEGRQVIAITHLAQIAAMADHHFEIRKSVESGSTVSRIRELNEEESVEELARILGGTEITEAVRSSAREMKEMAARVLKN
jgi:DNA repair protein RecN (Recombination protein N)